jgi:hypothetical protein
VLNIQGRIPLFETGEQGKVMVKNIEFRMANDK